ncbi:hypothetical protein M0R45_009368 [Rubus argutus]|uniref:non-specific serine/threonine protein kinase n=1 Tax=Rubus argutus TaxID=59490 RepID=A0AAW1Y3G3_RUBAR
MSPQFSIAELLAATQNFSPDLIVRVENFGLVYKSRLSNGLTVAIKRYDPGVFRGFRELRAEAEALGKLRHPNIIKLLGYCAWGSDKFLVYEFFEKGDLHSWLHNESTLSWDTRYKIIKGVAAGLAYLHGLEMPIIHRDIQPSSVLLDSDFEAHISHFQQARLIESSSRSYVTTQVAGTIGYMPPEYREGFTKATIKADVYSFGVLMLETATGMQPNFQSTFNGEEMGLVQWATKMVFHNRQMEMIDRKLVRSNVNDYFCDSKVDGYFRIALLCASRISRDRPAMREVVQMLNVISI